MRDLTIETVLSADFLNERNDLIFPDIGLQTIQDFPRISTRFLDTYRPEYSTDQLQNADVLLSLKPRVTAQSLAGAERLIAIGRFGVGYDNVDLQSCTQKDVAVYITRNAVVRP